LLCLGALVAFSPARQAAPEIDVGPVGEFSLTERSGKTITDKDLAGKVWVASFQFTRCTNECPQVSLTLKQLQQDLSGRKDVRFVTFTVDPKRDTLQDLNEYADRLKANPERWLFLTGDEKQIQRLMRQEFHLPEPAPGPKAGDIEHSQKLVVVDRQGHVRGYFDGLRDPREEDPEAKYQADLRKLARQVDELRLPGFMPRDVPRLNATLNALSACLIFLGYGFILLRKTTWHGACMLTALAVSSLFLASYLYFHFQIRAGQSTQFAHQAVGAPDWVGKLYYGILISHIVLAIIIIPLALRTTCFALRGRLARHVKLARWTLPIWVYVSITGVVVYWMLYRLYPDS
jgi:protein SCO1/2/putative membrane protein